MSVPEEKVYSGNEIEGLFSLHQSNELIVDFKGKKVKFVVRPMNNNIYSQIGDAIKSLGVDLDNENPLDGFKLFSNVYYPALKVVFPYCCVSPKVNDGPSTEPGVLNLETIPIPTCMKLFHLIMGLSGVSEEKEKERKKS